MMAAIGWTTAFVAQATLLVLSIVVAADQLTVALLAFSTGLYMMLAIYAWEDAA